MYRCLIHGLVPESHTRQVNVGALPGLARIHRGCQFQVTEVPRGDVRG